MHFPSPVSQPKLFGKTVPRIFNRVPKRDGILFGLALESRSRLHDEEKKTASNPILEFSRQCTRFLDALYTWSSPGAARATLLFRAACQAGAEAPICRPAEKGQPCAIWKTLRP